MCRLTLRPLGFLLISGAHRLRLTITTLQRSGKNMLIQSLRTTVMLGAQGHLTPVKAPNAGRPINVSVPATWEREAGIVMKAAKHSGVSCSPLNFGHFC